MRNLWWFRRLVLIHEKKSKRYRRELLPGSFWETLCKPLLQHWTNTRPRNYPQCISPHHNVADEIGPSQWNQQLELRIEKKPGSMASPADQVSQTTSNKRISCDDSTKNNWMLVRSGTQGGGSTNPLGMKSLDYLPVCFIKQHITYISTASGSTIGMIGPAANNTEIPHTQDSPGVVRQNSSLRS